MAGKRDFTGVHTGKPLLTFTCRCTEDKDKKKKKASMFGLWKGKWCLRGKQGEDYVLFCLDGVWWSHVVAGDITALASCQGTSEPPIPFSVTWRGREKKFKKRTYFTCCHVERIQSSFGEAALKDFLFLSSVGLLPIVCQNIKSYLHFCLYFYNVFYSETIILLHALYIIKQKKP